jgi:hypothetical protein
LSLSHGWGCWVPKDFAEPTGKKFVVLFCTCTVCDESLFVYTSYAIMTKLSGLLR